MAHKAVLASQLSLKKVESVLPRDGLAKPPAAFPIMTLLAKALLEIAIVIRAVFTDKATSKQATQHLTAVLMAVSAQSMHGAAEHEQDIFLGLGVRRLNGECASKMNALTRTWREAPNCFVYVCRDVVIP